MSVLIAVGFFILFLYQIFDKHTIRVQWDSVASFLAFMAMATFARIALYDYLNQAGNPLPQVPPEILHMGIWKFFFVFWEDAFFALPIYWAHKKLKPVFAWPITIVLSAFFGLGHLYQGWGVALILSLYPYFISVYFGKKYGFGTVMVCHVMYDFITFLTVWMLPYLIPSALLLYSI